MHCSQLLGGPLVPSAADLAQGPRARAASAETLWPAVGEANVPSSSLKSGLIFGLGSLGVLGGLITALWGYALWANTLPRYRPPLPPFPSPNGYTQAAAILAQMPPWSRRMGPLPSWPDGPPAVLRSIVLPARPLLDQIRAAFRLDWRVPFDRAGDITPELGQFREGAVHFIAESILAQSEGDVRTAMERRLDAMELGSKVSRGGNLIYGIGPGWIGHGGGFIGAERLVPELPASALPRALERVRRIRRSWPRFPEMLEVERMTGLARLSMIGHDYGQPTPVSMLQYLWEQVGPEGNSDRDKVKAELLLWLAPKRVALRHLDNCFRQGIAESKKPIRRRRAVSPPGDPVSAMFIDPSIFPQAERFWREVETELELLEVALAVRLYRLERGRSPARLGEMERRWLPQVPRDPWGQSIVYRLKHRQPVIYSLGPDGRDDGGKAVSPGHLPRWTTGDLVFGRLYYPHTRGFSNCLPLVALRRAKAAETQGRVSAAE
jgi:hypothetical protein